MILISFFFAVVDFSIMFFFMSSFRERRFTSRLINSLFVILISGLWIIISFVVPYNFYTQLTIIFTLTMVLLFEGNIKNRIILALSYVVIGKIIQYLGQFICELILNNETTFGWKYYYIAWFIALFIKGAYLYSACTHFGKDAVNYKAVPTDIGNLLMALSFILGLNCLMEIEVATEATTFYHKLLNCASVIIFLLSYNLLLYIMLRIIRHLEAYYLNKIDTEEIEYNEKLVKIILESEKEIHRIKHDIKNHLLECFHFIDRNDITGLRERVESICEDIKFKDDNKYTENVELNSVLQVKFGIAKSKNIEIAHNIVIPNKMKMQPGQLGLLFGNLLDNAIEASECIPEENRKIEVVAKMKHGDLIFIIRNNKGKDYRGFHSKKDDYVQHGFGISSVERVVNKYDGTLTIESFENTFEVSVILYQVA